MMKIEYLGHSCFRISLKNGMKIVTDPYTGVGYELPKNVSADVVTVSHKHFDHAFVAGVQGAKYFIKQAKEYRLDDIYFKGIETFHDEQNGTLRGKNIVYVIETEGIRLCHMGDIGEPCSSALVEKIGKVDVLLLPVGGRYTIDAIEAIRYQQALSPSIVIPMHYKAKDGSLDIDTADAFLSAYKNVKRVGKIYEIYNCEDRETQIIYMERE